jgi:putative hemolysin
VRAYTREMIKALSLSLGVLFITACAQPDPPRAVGMANPASVYCQSLGGKALPRSNDKGQYSICQLPDGTQIEEWELFRRDHPAK